MGVCRARIDNKVDGVWIKDICGKEPEEDSKYCTEHANRPRALKEKEDKALTFVVEDTGGAAAVIETVQQPQESHEIATKEAYKPTSIFDKVAGVLDNALQFEEDARELYSERLRMAKNGDPEALRYKDKAGAEQTRGEVQVYERAMDRTIRAVTAIAKLNIDNQAMQMNKILKDIVKQTILRVLQRMEMSPEEIDLARRYIAEEFAKQSKNAS